MPEPLFRKLFLLFLGGLFLAHPPFSAAQPSLSLRSETVFRAMESFDEQGDLSRSFPAYEYLRADVSTPVKGLSLHVYGWGRYDFAGKDHFANNPDGDLFYGYAEYAPADGNLSIRGGRQNVLSAGANETMDGVRVRILPLSWLSLEAYGGLASAVTDDDGADGDYLAGGRAGFFLPHGAVFGFSFKELANDGDDNERTLGVDAYFPLFADITLSGMAGYSLLNGGMAEFLVEARAPLGPLWVEPFYERYFLDNLFNTGVDSARPFRILALTENDISAVGARVRHPDLFGLETSVEAAMYQQEAPGGASWHVKALVAAAAKGLRAGGEAGRLQGFHEQGYVSGRLFAYWGNPLKAVSGEFLDAEAMVVRYDEEIFGKDASWHVSVGAGKFFLKEALTLSVAGIYEHSPYLDQELKATVFLAADGGI
ncbi:MAG: hypothetical protein JRI97_00820 [Deltaproteobacteria bacterium]|nr:hypothetical protein [Deltaproteobacteria bacterium]